jgi:hypothetical protein
LTLSYPDQLRAGIATYPLLSWDEPVFLPYTGSEFNSQVPESYFDEYIANLEPGFVESSDLEVRRVRLQSAISQHHRGPELYTRGSSNLPLRDRLSQLARLNHPNTKLPRGGLVIIHGVDDDVVLPEASKRFVNKARVALEGRQGVESLVLPLQPGNHGFDINTPLKEKWLGEAIQSAVITWLE